MRRIVGACLLIGGLAIGAARCEINPPVDQTEFCAALYANYTAYWWMEVIDERYGFHAEAEDVGRWVAQLWDSGVANGCPQFQ